MRLTDVRALLGGHLAGPPDPRQLPHRHASPSARWCRCARCRTAWSACSASTTASSRGSALVDGDDVLARTPVTGERDVRSEDRQLLLDAIGAATETLVVTYTGADEHSGQTRPPGRAPRRAARRPRPHRPRRRSASGSWSSTRSRRSTSATSRPVGWACRRPFTFDPAMLAAAETADRRCGRRRRRSSPSRCRRRRPTTSRCADLLAFFRDPVKGFFRALDLPCPGTSTASPTRCRSRSTRSRPGASATGCSPTCCAASTPTGARGRVAPRRAAARPARLAQGHRGPRPGDEARRRRAHAPPGRAAGLRRRRRPRRRPPAHRHRHARLRRPPGRGRLLPARRQAPAGVLGPAARARGRPPRPQLDRADDRPRRRGATRPPSGCSARGRRAADACSPTSSTSTTPGRRAPLPLPLKTSFAWACAPAPWRRARVEAAQEVEDQPATPARTPTPAHVRVWGGTPRSTAARPGASGEDGRGRAHPARRARRAAVAPAAALRADGTRDGALRPPRRRCPPAPARPCSRPAPAPARPSRSPAWSPATSPRARRRSTTCC